MIPKNTFSSILEHSINLLGSKVAVTCKLEIENWRERLWVSFSNSVFVNYKINEVLNYDGI